VENPVATGVLSSKALKTPMDCTVEQHAGAGGGGRKLGAGNQRNADPSTALAPLRMTSESKVVQ
jgi:hypothetical protein